MANPSSRAMPEEWFSIIMAVAAAIIAPVLIRYANWNPANHDGADWVPENHIYWTVPLWIGLFYLIIQMAFLLQSASSIRVLGVLDSILAILPLVSGLVLLALNIVDSKTFHFSSYQHSALAVLIVVGGAEFLLTIWIRFVVNRRTIGLGGGGDGN
ncbi:MAG: hypothetical protein WCD20_14635 [Rhodomicrobium sp.]